MESTPKSVKSLGWIGNIFLIVGLLTAGHQWRYAFAFTAIGETLWSIRAYYTRQWDIFSISAIFLIISLYNLFLWASK